MRALPIDDLDIERCLSEFTADKGLDYFLDGHVEEVAADPDGRRLWASVRGSRRQPYRVLVAWNEGPPVTIRGQCSCPMGSNCKHVAAALYAALDEAFDLDEDDAPLPRIPRERKPPPPPDPLAGPVGSWIDRMGRLAAAVTRPMVAVAEQLLYVVKLRKGEPATVQLLAQLVRPRQGGGFAVLQDLQFYSLFNPNLPRPAYVRAEDAVIGRLVAAGGWSSPTILPADPYIADLVLRRMIATGRCHWHDRNGPVLRQGAARPGSLAWTITADGSQRLTLAGGDRQLHVLHAAQPWYLDEGSGEAGPLEFAYPPEVLQSLLEAPPLSPAQVSAALPRLREQFAALDLPLPRGDILEDVRTLTPVPHLRLLTVKSPLTSFYVYASRGRDRSQALFTDMVVLNFAYEGKLINLQKTPDESRVLEAGRVVVRRRDRMREEAARAKLFDLGFAPPVYKPPGLKSKDGLVLEAGRHVNMAGFVHRQVAALRAEGWQIEIAENFRHRVVEAEGDWEASVGEGGAWWFSLDLGIDVEGERLALLPLLVRLLQGLPDPAAPGVIDDLAIDGSIYVQLADGRSLALPLERVRAIFAALIELYDANALKGDGSLDISLGHAQALAELQAALSLRWLGGERLRAMAERLKGFDSIRQVAAPTGLAAELRPYQQTGLDWLQFLRQYELGGILADDMGLGKTVQTLAHILVEKQAGRLDRPCLVVCPTSVVPNWRAEAARFAPGLKILSLHGKDRAGRFSDIAKADLVITSYALLPRDEKVLLEADWHLAVLDEAQAIKNPLAKTTQLACRLKARHRLCLTGTPLENHLGELWSQFAFLMPGMLGDLKRFDRAFRKPIEKGGDAARRALLAQRLRPFILRRTKGQVAADLPPKTEILQPIEISGDQRDLYETVRLAMHDKVREEIAAKGLARSHIIVLDALLKLRQACCDPRLVKAAAARKVKTSAKLDRLMAMLPDLIEEGRRILLFSQFTSMLDLIKPELVARDIPFVELRGDTTDRATPVKRFQNGEVPLFLISLKAGGTGLNLTAADTVIHYDPWWNPAVESQATDRAHRIGQDKPVFVYKLIAQGTVEERMVELQAKKRALVAAVLDAERPTGAVFAPEDLELLFKPIE